ncbi:MAG: molybdopterin cofactor-binding domain-containing protein, partial [Planctomycetota bacterium]
MQSSDEITIKVGFGDKFKELTVRIPEGDIPPYSPDEKLRLVGKSENRVDAKAKVTGRARYTYDQHPPGMLYGRILRCPHANANVRSVDLTRARAMPGIKAAISFPEVFEQSSIRFAWDGVAAVAAESEAQAEAALREIRIDYEVLPFCVTKEDAWQKDAPQVGRGNQKNVGRIFPRIRRRRDGSLNEEAEQESQQQMQERTAEVDQLLKKSDSVVEETFLTQVQAHASLETHGATCSWEDDRLICYASTQCTFRVRRDLTHPRGQVKAENAQVLCEYIGGGFGGKLTTGREGVIGALLAKQAGAPVRIMLDRREEHTSTGNRPDSRQSLTMGVNRDGEILAFRVRSWGTAGNGLRGAGAHNDAIYRLGVIDKIEYGVRTNCGGARAHRAPGWPQGVFALDSIMDMAAQSIGMDPIEFRKKNDEHPVRIAEYDIARKRIGWGKKFNPTPGSQKGPIKIGVGCGTNIWFSAGGGGASILVRIHKNGTVEVRNGAQDIGTGTRTIMGMVAAEELGLDLKDVQTFIGNTDDPRGPGSGKGPVKTGIGCASNIWFAAGGGGASVLVRIHKNGTVEVRNGAQDIGTGTRTIMGMVAAEELG